MKFHNNNQVAIVAGGQLLQQVITMGTGIILARAFGSSGYGVINIQRTLFTALMTVAPLGLDLALLKYCGRFPLGSNRVAITVVRLRLVTAVVSALIALSVGFGLGGVLMRNVYHYAHFDQMLIVTMVGLPFAADIGVMSAVYRAEFRAGSFALMTSYLQPALRLIMIVAVVAMAPSVFAIVAVNTMQLAISGLVIISHHIFSRGPGRPETSSPNEPIRWSEATDVLREAIWMAVNLLVYGMMRFVDILILGYFVTAREVGEYAALSTISQLVQVYPMAASQSLGPTISRSYHAGDTQGVRKALDNYIYLAAIVSAFIFSGIALFGPRLDLVFGASFHFRQDISILMPLGYLLSATLAPTGYALSMTGRHRAELGILAAGGVVLTGLCWVLIPPLGQLGAAIAVATSFLVINIVRFAYVARVLGFWPGDVRDLLPPLIGLGLAFLSRTIVDFGFDRNLGGLVVGCAVYGLLYSLICLIFLMRTEDRNAFTRGMSARLGALLSRRM